MEANVLGMTLSPVTDEIRKGLNLSEDTEGLVIMGVNGTSEAFTKGLREGDIITEHDGPFIVSPSGVRMPQVSMAVDPFFNFITFFLRF